MAPNQGVLGALLRSRCVSGAKAHSVAPRTMECTEKGQDFQSPSPLNPHIGAVRGLPLTYGGKPRPGPLIDEYASVGPTPGGHRDWGQPPSWGQEAGVQSRGPRDVTERPATPATAQRHSLWELAGVEIRAFGGREPGSLWWRGVFRAAIMLSLVVYARRVHPTGQALCLLWLRPWRLVGGIIGLLLVVCAAGALSPVLGAALIAAIAAILLPGVPAAVKARSASRQLCRLTPPGRHIYVHSVASQLPGAGAQLLRGLVLEADQSGWSLVLDASNEKLARYYEQFGFVPRGPGVQMPDGARHVRMWRPPIRPERGPLCGRAGSEVISTL
jgi:hypothetical protein